RRSRHCCWSKAGVTCRTAGGDRRASAYRGVHRQAADGRCSLKWMTPAPAAPHAAGLSLAEFEQLFEAVKNWGRWGSDDDRGALNYIPPARTREAMALVRSGRTVSLSTPLDTVAGPDNPRPVLHALDHCVSRQAVQRHSRKYGHELGRAAR